MLDFWVLRKESAALIASLDDAGALRIPQGLSDEAVEELHDPGASVES
jgi:hypothetical protein